MATQVITPPATQENDTLEFKREVNLQTLAPTVVAMLNHRGGAIFVGYSDTGDLVGLPDVTLELAQRLSKQLSEVITPKEVFDVTPQEDQGRFGLLIEVPPGIRKPYLYDGRIYRRSGTQSVVASANDISQMIAQLEDTDQRWEHRPAVGVDIEQLDREEILRTTEAADMRYAQPILLEKEMPFAALERLNLVQDNWPTQSAVILFKTEQVRRYTQASVRAVVFADEALRIISAERLFSAGAFSLFERLFDFLQWHLPVTSHLVPGARQRTVTPALPTDVLREAIVNALIHRNYQDHSSIQVRLFPDKLEIWNPGTLPDEYIHDMDTRPISRPRNPDIARVFHLRRYAELWGTGLWRIRREMAQAGLPPPEWRNEANGVLLSLPRFARTLPGTLGGEANEMLPRHIAFLVATQPGERLTRETYRNSFAPDISERSARNDLQVLQKRGYLRQTGQGYYRAYVRTEKAYKPEEALA